jgi:hypothetical protein
MDEPEKRHAPLDERALLEELERVREQIQQARLQRRAVQDEFSRFVRGFKDPTVLENATREDGRSGQPVTQLPARSETPQPEPIRPAASEGQQEPSGRARVMTVASATGPAEEITPGEPMNESPQAGAGAPRAQPWTRVLAGGAVILLAGVAVTTWMRHDPSEPAPSSDPTQTAQPATPAREPPAPATGAPAARGSEIVTIRRVWMRVMVDGERVLEREVPANTRVPLSAQKTIVIRTGDAGAVRLSIRGEDQGFLGGEGEVLTRSFTVRPGR